MVAPEFIKDSSHAEPRSDPFGFSGSMTAKEFLVSRIAEEAKRRHHPLRDVERQMLFFSENYPTLPNMADVAARFEIECDPDRYEAKIARLAKRAFQRDTGASPELARQWREAVRILNEEDHYILVMLDLPRSAKQWWNLAVKITFGLLIASCVLLAVVKIARRGAPQVPDWALFLVLALFLAGAYFLGLTESAMQKLERWFDRLLGL